MKKILAISTLLFTSATIAGDRASQSCISNGVCVPGKQKQEIVSNCKSVMNQAKGDMHIAMDMADYVVRKISSTLVNGNFVSGEYYSVDLSAVSLSEGDVSLMCVYDAGNKLVRIGTPVKKTSANMKIYEGALAALQ